MKNKLSNLFEKSIRLRKLGTLIGLSAVLGVSGCGKSTVEVHSVGIEASKESNENRNEFLENRPELRNVQLETVSEIVEEELKEVIEEEENSLLASIDLSNYYGESIEEALYLNGYRHDVESRKEIARALGMNDYRGRELQNYYMIQKLGGHLKVTINGVEKYILLDEEAFLEANNNGIRITLADLDKYIIYSIGKIVKNENNNNNVVDNGAEKDSDLTKEPDVTDVTEPDATQEDVDQTKNTPEENISKGNDSDNKKTENENKPEHGGNSGNNENVTRPENPSGDHKPVKPGEDEKPKPEHDHNKHLGNWEYDEPNCRDVQKCNVDGTIVNTREHHKTTGAYVYNPATGKDEKHCPICGKLLDSKKHETEECLHKNVGNWEYNAATNEDVQRCLDCGEIVNSRPHQHNTSGDYIYNPATGKDEKHCPICGELLDSKKHETEECTHKNVGDWEYNAATNEDVKYCLDCGEIVERRQHQHNTNGRTEKDYSVGVLDDDQGLCYIEYGYCSDHPEYKQEISRGNHNATRSVDNEYGYTATCGNDGCGKTIRKDYDICFHDNVGDWEYNAATNEDVQRCLDCGEIVNSRPHQHNTNGRREKDYSVGVLDDDQGLCYIEYGYCSDHPEYKQEISRGNHNATRSVDNEYGYTANCGNDGCGKTIKKEYDINWDDLFNDTYSVEKISVEKIDVYKSEEEEVVAYFPVNDLEPEEKDEREEFYEQIVEDNAVSTSEEDSYDYPVSKEEEHYDVENPIEDDYDLNEKSEEQEGPVLVLTK